MSTAEEKPRITSITIENFKSIGAPVTIPLKPFTLLFGKNSVGKSTIIEALLLMNDWMNNKGPDLDVLEHGGDVVHLGGFKRFVHKHDLSRDVRIRIDFDLGAKTLRRYPEAIIDSYVHGGTEDDDDDVRDLDAVDVHNLIDVKTCYCEIVVGQAKKDSFSDSFKEFAKSIRFNVKEAEKKIRFLEYNIGINGMPVITKKGFGHTYGKQVWSINNKHSAVIALKGINNTTRKLLLYQADAGNLRLNLPVARPVSLGALGEFDFDYFNDNHVPDFCYRAAKVHTGPVEEDDPVWKKHRIRSPQKITICDTRFISHFVSQVLLGTTIHMRDLLSAHIFIGPLRRVPQKVTSQLCDDAATWSDGMSAWKTLMTPQSVSDDEWTLSQVKGIQKIYKKHGVNFDDDKMAETWGAAEAAQHVFWQEVGINSRKNREVRVAILNNRLLKMGFGYGVASKAYYRLADDEAFMKSVTHLCEHPRSQQAAKALRSSIDQMRDAAEYEMVFVDRATGVELRPSELGMGVSQMIPVIMGALLSGPSIMSVQQPELHLHPALQCDLGDYLLSACGNSPKTILLETHSEHLILRLLRRIRETSQGLIPNENCEIRCTPDDLAVLYVDQASDGIRVSNLRVDEQGRFIDEWPEGFFEEGFNEIAGGL